MLPLSSVIPQQAPSLPGAALPPWSLPPNLTGPPRNATGTCGEALMEGPLGPQWILTQAAPPKESVLMPPETFMQLAPTITIGLFAREPTAEVPGPQWTIFILASPC